MRWGAALAAGALAALALAALAFAYNNFADWQSNHASNLAHIAAIERDAGRPNRDRALAEARGVMEVMNGAALERIGLSALIVALAIAALVPLVRYAARSLTRLWLALLTLVGAVLPVVIGGVVLFVLGVGAIRG